MNDLLNGFNNGRDKSDGIGGNKPDDYIANGNYTSQDKAFHKHSVVCCGVLEKMNLCWMKLEDRTKCMPYIKGHSGEVMYRVNNCPSCGKYVRDVMI